jgi:hypothetical protein
LEALSVGSPPHALWQLWLNMIPLLASRSAAAAATAPTTDPHHHPAVTNLAATLRLATAAGCV